MKPKSEIRQGPINNLRYTVYEINGQEIEFEEKIIQVWSAYGDEKSSIFVKAPVGIEIRQLVEALDLLKQELLNESA